MTKRSKIVLLLIAIVIVIILVPIIMLPGAEFEGTDAKGSDTVMKVTSGNYEPWFTPLFERLTGSALPGEIETLFFCIQTAIGVGVIAFCFGYLVARKKYDTAQEDSNHSAEKGTI